MSDRIGLVSYERSRKAMFLPEGFSPGKDYSEAKAAQICEEVSRLVEESHQRVKIILSRQRRLLNDLANLLSGKECVQGEKLRAMMSITERTIAA